MRKQWRNDLDTWVSPVLVNLLWVLFCIPVLSIPLGVVGLFACMYHWMDDRRTQVFSIFFGTIRRVWLKAYMLFVLDILIGGFLVFNLLIFLQMDLTNPLPVISLGATLLSIVIFLAANIPAWVLVAIWDAPFKEILNFSIRLVFAQPFWTIGMVLLIALIAVLSLSLPAAVFVTVTGAFIGYILTFGTRYIIRKYIDRTEFQLLDVI